MSDALLTAVLGTIGVLGVAFLRYRRPAPAAPDTRALDALQREVRQLTIAMKEHHADLVNHKHENAVQFARVDAERQAQERRLDRIAGEVREDIGALRTDVQEAMTKAAVASALAAVGRGGGPS